MPIVVGPLVLLKESYPCNVLSVRHSVRKTKSASYWTYRRFSGIQGVITQVVSLKSCDLFLVILETRVR